VANPNSVALRSSHPSNAPPNAGVSFGGRPDLARVAKAASPPRRQLDTHRHTDRSATPTTAATTAGSSPASTRSTAIRRTSRDGSAFRGVSIGTILDDVILY
jgi:hypothetical protein